MRRWLWISLAALLLAALGLGAWAYAHRGALQRQWACYRVGAAGSPAEAQAEIAWFEADAEDRQVRLDDLVGKWGTGNQRFDVYLASHLYDPACSDALREAFAAELDRRPELLPRWAHFWSWRTRQEPNEQIGSTVEYLGTLAAATPPATITWREVLDLHAVFELTGQGALAAGLSPANWLEHYRRWQQVRPAELPHIGRPKEPFESPL